MCVCVCIRVCTCVCMLALVNAIPIYHGCGVFSPFQVSCHNFFNASSTQFNPKTSNGHNAFFPMPFYTPTSAVLDMVLSNVSYNISGKHNRLALEVLLVHGPAVSGGGISQRYSADDEYTPSVFYNTIYNIEQNQSSSPGYVTWKAISYMDGMRISSNSQQMSYNPDPAGSGPLQDFKLPESLARAVYGDRPVEVKRMFLVFGSSGADLSLNAQYFTW